MNNPNVPFTWRPALDGLRGIAVVAVVLFHFKTKPLLPGGSLGVDVFFALSGFLITTLLLEEWLASGAVSLPRFYMRRFLRLFPALLALVVVNVAIQIAFTDSAFSGTPSVRDTLTSGALSLTYVYSWAIAFESVSQFPFGHLWSLSVEEQYYVLWPGLLLIMLRSGISLRRVMAITAALAVISASVPIVLGGASWHRLYFGADYRVHGLLIGSIAGMLFAGGMIRRQHAERPIFITGVTVASAYIAALMLFASDKAALMFTIGFPLLGIGASMLVIACAYVDRGLPLLILGNRAIVYVGKRSYAIYLWHLPISDLFRNFSAAEQLIVGGAATLLAAEASHWLVERPALSLKGRFARSQAELESGRLHALPGASSEQAAA